MYAKWSIRGVQNTTIMWNLSLKGVDFGVKYTPFHKLFVPLQPK